MKNSEKVRVGIFKMLSGSNILEIAKKTGIPEEKIYFITQTLSEYFTDMEDYAKMEVIKKMK